MVLSITSATSRGEKNLHRVTVSRTIWALSSEVSAALEDTFPPSLEKSQVATLRQWQSSLLPPEHRIQFQSEALGQLEATAMVQKEEILPPLATPRLVAGAAVAHVALAVQTVAVAAVAAEGAAISRTLTGRALVAPVKVLPIVGVEHPDLEPQTKGSPVFPEPLKAEEREAQPEQELSPTLQGVL